MYHCYILYSEKLDKYYIGSTFNVQERLRRHNSSNRGFTSAGKPWELKYAEEFKNKSLALNKRKTTKKLEK